MNKLNKIFNRKVLSIFFIVIGSLCVGASTYVLAEELWLENTTGGTIKRSIWFIHPTDDRPTIAIISDQYTSNNIDEEFTLVVHGIGNMNLTERGAVWSRGIDGVQVEIFGNISSLEKDVGYNAEFKTMEPYLKVNFTDKGSSKCVWVAIATKNNQTLPITYLNKQIIINSSLIVSVPNNQNDNLSIESSYGDSTPFEFFGDIFIEANDSNPFVMGTNIYDMAKIQDIPDDFGKVPSETFELSGGQRILAENYTIELDNDEIIPIIPILESDEIKTIIDNLPETGPWLYTNDSERISIKNRLDTALIDSIDYKLSLSINNSAQTAMTHNFSDITIGNLGRRPSRARDLAFHAWLYQNTTEIIQVYELMKNMDEHIVRIDEEPKMLRHGIALADYVIAWDFAQSLFTNSQETNITGNMEAYGAFVMDYLPHCGTNNWETVVSSGVGLAGLKLHNADMIHATFEKLDHYINENVRVEGGIYEGQGYIGYAFSSHKRFIISCARYEDFGLSNYFKDGRFQSIFQFGARCITPDGYYPLFEDAQPSTSGSTNGFILSQFFSNAGNEQLAKELTWVYNFHDVNSTGDAVQKILFANYSITPSEPILPLKYDTEEIYVGASYVAQDSGLVMFRNNWSTNAAFLTTSAKNYLQSHDHYDEFTFEFWANGVKLLGNPGYPGWGFEHHDWTITTEASNGAILFSGNGQTHEDCNKGIIQWLRGKNLDYVQMEDDNIYGPKHNSLFPNDFYWVVPLGYILGIVFIIIPILKVKKSR